MKCTFYKLILVCTIHEGYLYMKLGAVCPQTFAL